MFIDAILLGLVGKLLIFTIQKHPITKKIQERSWFLDQLLECDFCLGFWVYFVIFLIFRTNLFMGYFPYIPVITEGIESLVISFLVHLISIGWRDKFSIIIVGE